MCYFNDDRPRVMVRYKDSDVRTAMTVAHEIGHVLGIHHDFRRTNEREYACGKNEGKFVMAYGDGRIKWSDCSNYDFKVYYNKVIVKRDFFCLQPACNQHQESRACICKKRNNYCAECEVECTSDCNDIKYRGGECFSSLACSHSLLLEKDCRPSFSGNP